MSLLTPKFNKVNQFVKERIENKPNLVINRTKAIIHEPRQEVFASTLFNGSVKSELQQIFVTYYYK